MSKVYDIGFKRYKDYKIRVCGKDSNPLIFLCSMVNGQNKNVRSCIKIFSGSKEGLKVHGRHGSVR